MAREQVGAVEVAEDPVEVFLGGSVRYIATQCYR